MSYEIIRCISVRDNKVFMRSSANNVFPKSYEEWECTSLSAILKEEGRQALDLEILKQYEGGMFKGGKNRYTRALNVLHHMPEYAAFDWRSQPYETYREAKASQAFLDLLKKALNTQLPKDKFIIQKRWRDGAVFLKRISRKTARWVAKKAKATVFRYRDEAEDYKRRFNSTDDWQIVSG